MSAENKNVGKPRPSLVMRDMPNLINEMIKVRALPKYHRDNFKESIGKPEAKEFLDDNRDSIWRHIIDIECGELRDKESGLLHAAHIAVRCGFECEYAYGEDLIEEDIEVEDVVEEPVYYWKDAPDWAEWMAKDEDGEVYYYKSKPSKCEGSWNDTANEVGFEVAEIDIPGFWEESLMERPK